MWPRRIDVICKPDIFVHVLQEKRSAFPRFYFIGDDDLLEILGQATNPHVIQSHLKKLFGGLFSLGCGLFCSLPLITLHSLDKSRVLLAVKITCVCYPCRHPQRGV